MYDENDLIHSPLQREFTADGKTVEIYIYRMPHTGWTLEVVDEYNNSTVWDDEFKTDQEAMDMFHKEYAKEGMDAFIGEAPSRKVE